MVGTGDAEATVRPSARLVGLVRGASKAAGVIAGRTSPAGITCEIQRGRTLVCGVVGRRRGRTHQNRPGIRGGSEVGVHSICAYSNFQPKHQDSALSPHCGHGAESKIGPTSVGLTFFPKGHC